MIGPATREAARALLDGIDPAAYAGSRNHLNGAVTRLSAHLTHGVIDLRDVLRHLQRAHRLPPTHKLVFELGWREFFRHCWRHDGDAIFSSLHPGLLPDDAYARELPPDIREARTGLPVVDRAVRELHQTGYLHNHARLWLASYVIHSRKIHWRVGADWMWSHLLDGDLASNHLSWQWVAGTASAKPYLFNAENVRRHAPAEWHIDGSALDAAYPQLERMARDPDRRMEPTATADPACNEPECTASPESHSGFTPPDAERLRGLDVWVVHAWCLRDPPAGRVPVAILDTDFHTRRPWSRRRWNWILERMQSLAAVRWMADGTTLTQALGHARSIGGQHDPHLGALGAALALEGPAVIWPEPGRRQRSFSAWWSRVQPLTPTVE